MDDDEFADIESLIGPEQRAAIEQDGDNDREIMEAISNVVLCEKADVPEYGEAIDDLVGQASVTGRDMVYGMGLLIAGSKILSEYHSRDMAEYERNVGRLVPRVFDAVGVWLGDVMRDHRAERQAEPQAEEDRGADWLKEGF